MNTVQIVASKVFNCYVDEIKVVRRLLGGKSNQTYLFEFGEKQYTFRIPGKNAFKFVDRNIEEDNLKIARKLGLLNHIVHIDKENGYMIAEYVEGYDLSAGEANLEEVSRVLKSIHNSGINAENDYDPIGRLELYESYNKELDYAHEDAYFDLKNEFMTNLEFLNTVPKTLAHNDSQRANFIQSEDKLFLLDWEYAGNNDPLYDIACFGNTNFDDAIALLKVYSDNPTQEEYKRIYLWRAFQCLQWHNVAMYKELIGLSSELQIDFKKVAAFYINLCRSMLDNANNCR